MLPIMMDETISGIYRYSLHALTGVSQHVLCRVLATTGYDFFCCSITWIVNYDQQKNNEALCSFNVDNMNLNTLLKPRTTI